MERSFLCLHSTGHSFWWEFLHELMEKILAKTLQLNSFSLSHERKLQCENGSLALLWTPIVTASECFQMVFSSWNFASRTKACSRFGEFPLKAFSICVDFIDRLLVASSVVSTMCFMWALIFPSKSSSNFHRNVSKRRKNEKNNNIWRDMFTINYTILHNICLSFILSVRVCKCAYVCMKVLNFKCGNIFLL